jgi:hypothetical protein
VKAILRTGGTDMDADAAQGLPGTTTSPFDPTPPDVTDPFASTRPGVGVATLAATRVRVESAEWHLRCVVEIGDRLMARHSGFDAVASGNDEVTIAACRKVVDDPAIGAALVTVERAREALAELAKWRERGDG